MSEGADLLIELNAKQVRWLDQLLASGCYGKTREEAAARLIDAGIIRYVELEMPLDPRMDDL